jgi:hypothetical protein
MYRRKYHQPKAPPSSAPAYSGWRRPNVVVGVFAAALFVGFFVLSFSGFCLGTSCFLSDEKAIDAAVDDVLTLGMHVIETPSGGYTTFRPEREVRYTDRNEFRRVNPDCCKIVAHDPVWIDFRHRLFGYAAKSVFVRYMVRYVAEYGGVSQMEAVAQRAIGNCGHVLNTGR